MYANAHAHTCECVGNDLSRVINLNVVSDKALAGGVGDVQKQGYI